MLKKTDLSGDDSGATTLLLELDDPEGMEIPNKPGDRLGVFTCNKIQLIEGILERLEPIMNFDTPMEHQTQNQSHTLNETVKTWVPHEKFSPN
ncbi:hypothetical protein HCN44_007819 [Aphidius gifuensis]|uniref:Uncharacterized protein n=1 Tax=Aphidius gifuensis TaxID=684658 RepID=A0A835CME7_APHGI|nr:hypothetical protein HCN44_007819 [Aphidius gifuensis]